MDADLRKTQEEEAEKGEDQRTWKKKRGVCDCRGMKGEREEQSVCVTRFIQSLLFWQSSRLPPYIPPAGMSVWVNTICVHFLMHTCKCLRASVKL